MNEYASYYGNQRIKDVWRYDSSDIMTEFGQFICQESLGSVIHPLEILPKNETGAAIATAMYQAKLRYPIFTMSGFVYLFELDHLDHMPYKISRTEFRQNLSELTRGLLREDSFR